MRGGAFKPRSSPYSFQGMGEEGLKIMRAAADRRGLAGRQRSDGPDADRSVTQYSDILQIGARNMQNFNLLREIGKTRKPVLLKRGIAATIEELLLAAEYIMSGGNYDVILCERGIRTFETYTRNTMDIAAIPVVKKLSHLPIVGDPSHGTGRRDMVTADGSRRGGGGGGRVDRRGASGSRQSRERRRADADAGAVHRDDAAGARDRGGGRQNGVNEAPRGRAPGASEAPSRLLASG